MSRMHNPAILHIHGKLANGGKVTVDVKDGKVVLEFEEEAVVA